MNEVYLSTPGDVRDEASATYKDIFPVLDASNDLASSCGRLAW